MTWVVQWNHPGHFCGLQLQQLDHCICVLLAGSAGAVGLDGEGAVGHGLFQLLGLVTDVSTSGSNNNTLNLSGFDGRLDSLRHVVYFHFICITERTVIQSIIAYI
jgi:hypothetical protein